MEAGGSDLLKARDSQGRQPIHWVCHNRCGPAAAAAVQALLRAGSSASAQDNADMQPLHCCASSCETGAAAEAAIQALVAAGASTRSRCMRGALPLHYCGQNGSAEGAAAAVRALLAAGSRPGATCNRGGTALHWVAKGNEPAAAAAVIGELLAAQPDLAHARCSAGGTALHWCATCGDTATAAAAIAALAAMDGNSVCSKDRDDGDEPIHWAVQSNEDREAAAAAVTALIAAGADPHVLGSRGKPPVREQGCMIVWVWAALLVCQGGQPHT